MHTENTTALAAASPQMKVSVSTSLFLSRLCYILQPWPCLPPSSAPNCTPGPWSSPPARMVQWPHSTAEPSAAAHSHTCFPTQSHHEGPRKQGGTAWPGTVGEVGMLPAVLLHPCVCPGEQRWSLGLVNGMGAFLPSVPDDRDTSDASYIITGNSYILKSSSARWDSLLHCSSVKAR